MTTQAAQLQFAAEFWLFIAAVAAIATTALKPDLLVRRTTMRIGFLAGAVGLATAAFLHGSLLVEDATDVSIVALRLGGAVAMGLAIGSAGAIQGTRVASPFGLAAIVAAEAVAGLDWDTASHALRGAGALLLAIGLLVASRRAIAAKVAAAAAVVVLLAITALSIALSVVIADNVENEVAQRFGARAETEAQLFTETSVSARSEAELLAYSLRNRQAVFALISDASAPESDRQAAVNDVSARLGGYRDQLLRLPSPGPLLVVDDEGRRVTATDASDIVRIQLEGSRAVSDVLSTRRPKADIAVVGDEAFAIGAAPVVAEGGSTFLGVAAITSRLDSDFLDRRIADPVSVEQQLALTIADRSRRYSTAGDDASLAATLTVAGESMRSGERETDIDGDQFLVAVPVVNADRTPVVAVVVTVPRASIDATREDLFRLLFVVALVAGLVAMLLAGYAGNQVGSDLVRLTDVASAVEEGDFRARAEIASIDELGTLGDTFNHMAFSLESMTTSLREAAEEEAALRSRIEGVIGGMGEALVAVGVDGSISDFNAAAEELIGVSSHDALGGSVADVCTIVTDDDVDVTDRFVEPVVDSWSVSGEVVGTRGPAPIVATANPLRDASGTLIGAVFVIRDVRREREIDRMKTEFIANVSHELRTPLTPILGYSDLLASRDVDSDRVKTFANEINNGARQLGRVTDQLVQFATIAAGKLQLDKDLVAPRTFVKGVIDRWNDRVPSTHTIARRVARGAPSARVDRGYLEVALDELLDNAVKYSPEGGRIRVSARAHENGRGTFLELRVEDQGVGIDADRLEAIFDDFSQGDGSATRRFGGLGLGLSLVNRIAKAHGGELACQSEVGKGTSVRMLIPASADVEDDG